MASSVARAQSASRMQVAARLHLSGAKEGNSQGCLFRGARVFVGLRDFSSSLAPGALPKSATKGVTWHRQMEKWDVRVQDPVSGKSLHLGLHLQEKDAVDIRECAHTILHGSGSDGIATSQSPRWLIEDVQMRIEKVRNRSFTSKYCGVARIHPDHVRNKQWRASTTSAGKTVSFGRHETEEEAARAFDEGIRQNIDGRAQRLRSLNFKVDSDYFDIQTWEQEPIPEGKTSCFMGVRKKSSARFVARSWKTGQNLGSYASELEAAASFDKASLAEDGPTNFQPRTHEAS